VLSTCDSMCLRSLLDGFQSKDVAKQERKEEACCFLEEGSMLCRKKLLYFSIQKVESVRRDSRWISGVCKVETVGMRS